MRLFTLISVSFITQLCQAQSNTVVLSIEPRTADVGETVVIHVNSTVQGEIEVDNLPGCFVFGQDMMDGMNTEIDYNTGKIVTYYRFSRTGAFSKSGKYTIGPAYVKQGNKTYKSNTVVVTVGDKTEMTSSDVTAQQLRDPAFGVIQTSKTTLYEGEPVLVSAKVYSRFNPTYLDRYVPYSMKGAIDKHPIGNNGVTKTELELFRGMDFFTFEYDRNVIFPVGTGDFKIRSFTMSLYDDYRPFPLTSSSAVITIKPLPPDPPADFIGAVGRFDIERFVEDHNLKQGDVFKLRIVVSGTGNLQNILEPKPELPQGFIIYGDPEIEENFSYTSQGAEGSISYEYNIQVSKYGELSLPASSISYFDVKEEKYVTVKTDESTLTVKKNKDFVVEEIEDTNDAAEEKVDELASLRKSKIYENDHELFGSPLFWSGVSVPFLTALLFLIFVKRREKSEEEIAVRHQLRQKEHELSNELAQLKIKLASGDHTGVYSGIEHILRTAIEKNMGLVGEQSVSRQEMFAYLDEHGKSALTTRIRELMNQCDQQRYGFGGDNASSENAVNELHAILEQLKA